MATAEKTGNSVIKDKGKRDYFVRFSARQRTEHWILVVSFIVLAVTGLAQRYYTAGWAEWVILNSGGIEFTRLIHRAVALLFTLLVIYHFGYVAYQFFYKHARLSMVPTLKDFHDVVNGMKYTLGLADRPPQLGRFDYRQKFEYWGLIFGSLVLIISGFILAFPVTVTRVVPGQVVAAAVEFHGFEATLAVLTIVIWHLYDVIFRPGVFPADTSILTGKISRERMLEEHPLEYAELEGYQVDGETDTPSSEEGQSNPHNE